MVGQIEAIQKLVESDLAGLVPPETSWHAQYRNSAYIYIGNLDLRLTEGDIVTVFSQFGDIVDIYLARDKDSGKFLGYGFLAFEDQRSTILAIDNMVGYVLLGRPIRIDHVADFKPPRRYDSQNNRIPYEASGAEGQGIRVYNVTRSQQNLSKRANSAKSQSAEDNDEAWAKTFEESLKTIKDEP